MKKGMERRVSGMNYPSLGLDEYMKDIDEMPSALLDLFDEEELGKEIDLTSRAPPDFEAFIRWNH